MSFWKTATSKNLFVVSDFDKTLTKAFIEGVKMSSTIAVFRNANIPSTAYAKESEALAQQYLPVEKDTTLTIEQKFKPMQEWWEKHLELFVKYRLSQQDVIRALLESKLTFRDQAREFFKLTKNCPVLIFSAGNGNIISQMMQPYMQSNIHIHSNFFLFGSDGFVKGYDSHIITSVNKDHRFSQSHTFNRQVQGRTHLLLLGDAISDLGMKEHFAYEHLFSIGFCNEGDSSVFAKHFDMVIEHDGSLEKVNDLLRTLKR